MSPEEFMQRVDFTGPCWVWQGGVSCEPKVKWEGRYTGVTRVAWMIAFGSLSKKVHLKRKCKNIRCVRPEHYIEVPQYKAYPHRYNVLAKSKAEHS